MKPAITEPPRGADPGFNDAERATIYYIAGYLLRVVHTRLAKDNESCSSAVTEWSRVLVDCCSVPLSLAREQRMPIEKVLVTTRGGLIYSNSAFFQFAIALEHVFVHNLTPAHVEAYPTTLMTEVRKLLPRAKGPPAVLAELVVPCLPLDMQDRTVPAAFFATVYETYCRMRTKDFALTLHRSYDQQRACDASAGTVTHRAVMASNAASAVRRKRSERGAKQTLPESSIPEFPFLGVWLVGKHVLVLFDIDPDSSDGDDDDDGETDKDEGGQRWFSGTINRVDLAHEVQEARKPARMAKVAHVTSDIGEPDWWFEMRDVVGGVRYWHGACAGER